mmetsp:Transcript_111366/g.315006  ORF Transcript_111366/g.315006 Transcript_111366/m.315006 type:complete len:282 (-) Transcript_111366:750-1595(-)
MSKFAQVSKSSFVSTCGSRISRASSRRRGSARRSSATTSCSPSNLSSRRRSEIWPMTRRPSVLCTEFCCRNFRTMAVFCVWSCLITMYFTICVERKATVEAPKNMPVKRRITVKIRSTQFSGITSEAPSVSCATVQCREERYWYGISASLMLAAVAWSMGVSSHRKPVSLGPVRPRMNQAQLSTWQRKRVPQVTFRTSLSTRLALLCEEADILSRNLMRCRKRTTFSSRLTFAMRRTTEPSEKIANSSAELAALVPNVAQSMNSSSTSRRQPHDLRWWRNT